MAYQIAFDLYESATQHFLRRVQDEIRSSLPTPPTLPHERGEEEGGEKLSIPVQETGGGGREVGEVLSVPIQETGDEGRYFTKEFLSASSGNRTPGSKF